MVFDIFSFSFKSLVLSLFPVHSCLFLRFYTFVFGLFTWPFPISYGTCLVIRFKCRLHQSLPFIFVNSSFNISIKGTACWLSYLFLGLVFHSLLAADSFDFFVAAIYFINLYYLPYLWFLVSNLAATFILFYSGGLYPFISDFYILFPASLREAIQYLSLALRFLIFGPCFFSFSLIPISCRSADPGSYVISGRLYIAASCSFLLPIPCLYTAVIPWIRQLS